MSASDWQGFHMGMIFHFNMETFNNPPSASEWALGSEANSKFNPSNLDINQWLDQAEKAGAEYVILTTVHHDGYCIWPSATSTHNISGSPAYSTVGDVVKNFTDLARGRGFKVGLYFSVWDRFYEAAVPGATPTQYTTWVVNKLTEVLTRNGKIDLLMTDGWGWSLTSDYTIVPYATIRSLLTSLQPDCALLEHNVDYNRKHTDIISIGIPDGPGIPEDAIQPTEISTSINFISNVYLYFTHDGDATVAAYTGQVKNMPEIWACKRRGIMYTLNIGPDTTGQIRSDMVAIVDGMKPDFQNIVDEDPFTLNSGETASNAYLGTGGGQPHTSVTSGTGWRVAQAAAASAVINPDGKVILNGTDSGFYTVYNVVPSSADHGARIGIGWHTLTDCSVGVMIRAKDSAGSLTEDLHCRLERLSGVFTFKAGYFVSASYTDGLTITLPTGLITVNSFVELEVRAVGTSVLYKIYVDGVLFAQLKPATNTDNGATGVGKAGLYIWNSGGVITSTTGPYISHFELLTPDTTAPSAPSGLVALGNSLGTVLSWSQTNGATTYNIYRSTDNSTYTKVGASRMTAWLDQSSVSGTPYYYKVAAVDRSLNESTKSSASPIVTAGHIQTVGGGRMGIGL